VLSPVSLEYALTFLRSSLTLYISWQVIPKFRHHICRKKYIFKKLVFLGTVSFTVFVIHSFIKSPSASRFDLLVVIYAETAVSFMLVATVNIYSATASSKTRHLSLRKVT
jgi:hypothetical protein